MTNLQTELFRIIPDAQVILNMKGTFFQRKVYRRGTRLYAGSGAGFVRLGAGDATSAPNVSWEGLDIPEYLHPNITFERLQGPVWQNNK